MQERVMPQHICLKCGHEWHSHRSVCPKCGIFDTAYTPRGFGKEIEPLPMPRVRPECVQPYNRTGKKWTKKKAKRAKKLLALVQKKVAETTVNEAWQKEFLTHYRVRLTTGCDRATFERRFNRVMRLTAIAQHATKGL